MSGIRPILQAPDEGQTLSVLGERVLVKLHGRDTGGIMSQLTTTTAPGGGPPPHLHRREDETFYVIEGEYEVTVGGETKKVTPGMVAFLPRNIPHTFRNVGSVPGKLLVTLTPAGFEGFFEGVGALNSVQQQDIPRVLGLGRKFGLEFLPPATSNLPEPIVVGNL